MSKLTRSLESATRKQIDLILSNLGWNIDESSKDCNVFTERAKTVEQNSKFRGLNPDYVLYKSGTDGPIAIIEAKRKGKSVDQAIVDSYEKYAKPLGVRIIFAYDGAFFKSWHTEAQKELSIDGAVVTQLVPEKKLLRFLKEGYSISEVTPTVKHSRSELISIFKWANDLLRKEGLRKGIERFTEFANLIFLKLISELEHEREKNEEPRILDVQYCWEAFADMNEVPMMNYVNDTVLPKLVEDYNHSGEVFQSKLLIKSSKTLKSIVGKLSSINLMDADSDVKGDAFEYFIKDSVTVGNDLGEYFTPRHIVNLMIELIEPKFGEKIYDPTCGTGGFLIASFNYIKRRCAKTKENYRILREETVYGRELTNTAKIAKMNMILTGDGHTNIKQMDSLENPVEEEYDVVLANIPYGQSTDYGGLYFIPSNDGDSVFIQHIFKSLKKEGRAAVVVPEGLLFKGGDMLKTRKYLLKNTDILGVISLPQGVFRPYADNKTDIIVFQRNKTGTKSVWFCDLTADGFDLKSDFRRPVDENDIPDLLEKWVDKTESEKSWKADFSTISANKYSLVAKNYAPKDRKYETQYPLVKFSEIMKEARQVITIDDKKEYQRITVQWYGKGIIPRERILGSKIKIKEQKETKADQFIVAEIDAKNGSFGVIPKELAGSIVSSHYFLFDLDKTRVIPKYIDYMVRFGPTEELISPFVKGTTNYSDVRPADVLQLKLPLPSQLIQSEIVEEIDRQLRINENAMMTLKSMEEAAIDPKFFKSDKTVKLTDVADVNPTYELTPNSLDFFVDMASLDELKGEIRAFNAKKTISSGLSRFREDDILFARITPCTENGKVAIAQGLGEETGLGSTEFVVLKPDKEKIAPKWLYFYMKNHEVRRNATEVMLGTTNRQRVPLEFFKTLSIPEIPIEEQQSQVKELEGYIEAKMGLLKAIALSEKAVKNIVEDVYQVSEMGKQPRSDRSMDRFLKSTT